MNAPFLLLTARHRKSRKGNSHISHLLRISRSCFPLFLVSNQTIESPLLKPVIHPANSRVIPFITAFGQFVEIIV
jgi:hypothetical protein